MAEVKKKKLAIMGASYLQEPLIQTAKSCGIETHVFAWAADDVGEKSADYFYPISLTEKEEILEKCKEIGVDGVATIASDLATIPVGYVAEKMGLIGNTTESVEVSTNKHKMRQRFEKNGDPSPKSICIETVADLEGMEIQYPCIVKPLDRSGSRGVTKVESWDELTAAVENGKKQGFIKRVLVEEFISGNEYSVEFISWEGEHTFLALTKKFTTGAPHFIETGHMEPADVSEEMVEKIKQVVSHALDSLDITYGASHAEIKITEDGEIYIIEIGARMGGDLIGSSLVQLSTGVDFVKAVMETALGIKPTIKRDNIGYVGIRFIFDKSDVEVLDKMKAEDPDIIKEVDVHADMEGEVTDSSTRFGYYLFASEDEERVKKYLG